MTKTTTKTTAAAIQLIAIDAEVGESIFAGSSSESPSVRKLIINHPTHGRLVIKPQSEPTRLTVPAEWPEPEYERAIVWAVPEGWSLQRLLQPINEHGTNTIDLLAEYLVTDTVGYLPAERELRREGFGRVKAGPEVGEWVAEALAGCDWERDGNWLTVPEHAAAR